MSKEELNRERFLLARSDEFFYAGYDNTLNDIQINELVNFIIESRKEALPFLEASFEEPALYDKDVLLEYLRFKEKIIKFEIELLKTLRIG